MRGFRVDRYTYILRQVQPDLRILHIGCTSAPNTIKAWNAERLLHKKLCDKAKSCGAHVVGLDLDEISLAWLKERMPDAELIHGDAQNLQDRLGSNRSFDLIIAGEVIEHLPNPGLFLESCLPLLSTSGRMLITTVNAFGIARYAKALLNHEAVHPEHTAYFSHRTLTRLCSMCGFQVRSSGYCKGEPLAEFTLNRFCSNLLEGVVSVIYPQFSDGIALEIGPAANHQIHNERA